MLPSSTGLPRHGDLVIENPIFDPVAQLLATTTPPIPASCKDALQPLSSKSAGISSLDHHVGAIQGLSSFLLRPDFSAGSRAISRAASQVRQSLSQPASAPWSFNVRIGTSISKPSSNARRTRKAAPSCLSTTARARLALPQRGVHVSTTHPLGPPTIASIFTNIMSSPTTRHRALPSILLRPPFLVL